ncbi:MAG: sugar-binding protein [Capnocytophaga sp.]|nr:sugar-binding protein [Capnocytophaga sp.]
MKRINKFCLFVVLFAISATLQAQIDTISSKSLLLKGKIKKIEDYSYFLEPNLVGKTKVDNKKFEIFPLSEDWNIERDKTKYSKTNISYAFDKAGKNMDVTTYISEKKPFGGMKFKYDVQGKIIESQTVFTASDGDFVVDKKYFYNEKNQLVKIDEHEASEWLLTMTFKYDDLGNCIEKNKVASLSVLEKDIQKYEEKNLILEKKIRSDYTREKHYKYNNFDKVTHTEELFPDLGIFLKVENEYDKENNLIKSKYLNEDNQETICVHKYYKGKLVQTICTANDDPTFYLETNFSYGASGETETIKTKTEVISKKVYNKNGLLVLHKTAEFDHRYKYSFDKKGNWREVILYENNTPTKIRFRKIEYY